MFNALNASLIVRAAATLETVVAFRETSINDTFKGDRRLFVRAYESAQSAYALACAAILADCKGTERADDYSFAIDAELDKRITFRKNDMERRVRDNEHKRLAREEAARVARLAAQKKLKMAA